MLSYVQWDLLMDFDQGICTDLYLLKIDPNCWVGCDGSEEGLLRSCSPGERNHNDLGQCCHWRWKEAVGLRDI